jgi:hypothetical protein
MRPLNRLVAASATALGFAAVLAACDKPPTAPGPSPTPGPGPTAPGPPGPDAPPSLTRLELDGPASVPPGETAQYTATAFYSDGSSRNVSGEAFWMTGSRSVLSISTTGLASGHVPGESQVTLKFALFTATKWVFVLRPGTYQLTGIVKDGGLPVSGAEVAVSAGSAEGLSTTSRFWGYKLFGVSGDTEIRVRRPGYQEQKRRIVATAHERLDFDLALSSPRDQVHGTWTLTITAADECGSKLSEEATQRRYTAVLSQNGERHDGPSVTATLAGSTFYSLRGQTLNTFQGRVEPDRVTFQLAGAFYDDGYFGSSFLSDSVVEQLSAVPTFFSVSGSVVLNTSGNRRTGLLEGTLATYAGVNPKLLQSCDSSRHRFELTR